MKKVCVSTFCEWSSYGSVLQAIALKQTLSDLGFESFIIRDVPAPVAQKSFRFVLTRNPKLLIKEFLDIRYNKTKERLYKNSVGFINENVDVKYYNNFKALEKRPPEADYYIAGSDQIWHPSICKQAFFLDFLLPDVKRLSYAASMGSTNVAVENEKTFSDLISKFDTVSVREIEMASVIRKYTDKPIHRHIDPTFLVNADFWRTLSTEYTIEKPYILVYALYWDPKYNKELKKLHKKTGYDVVALCPSGSSRVWANKKIFDAHPGQFLYLIDNAEAVVSSSFHGVALSMNFNKKFVAVVNPKLPSRLNTLLDIFNIKAIDISNVMDFDLSSYESINKKIESEKQISIQYLKEVLV